MKITSILCCLLFLLFFGCNEIYPKGEKDIPTFITQWNDAHTQLKSPFLENNYMDVVQYYGTERTRIQVQEDKEVLFDKFPEYKQQLHNDQLSITKEGGSYLVVFENQVQYSGVKAVYETYLLLTLENSKFKILREGVADTQQYREAPIFPKNRKKLQGTTTREVFGDFNGDNLSDYAYVENPELEKTTESASQITSPITCKGACDSMLYFSAENLSPIIIKNSYKSQLENLKDLNGDGADEIGYWDLKPNAKTLHIFDATTASLLTAPVVINTTKHKNLDLIDVFKKTGPNKITVTRSVEKNGKWTLESEIITLD